MFDTAKNGTACLTFISVLAPFMGRFSHTIPDRHNFPAERPAVARVKIGHPHNSQVRSSRKLGIACYKEIQTVALVTNFVCCPRGVCVWPGSSDPGIPRSGISK